MARAFGSYPKCPRFESRCRYQKSAAAKLLALFIWPVGQVVKTPPFHGGNMGSNPVRVTIFGPVVQLVRMPPCHGGDHGFKSHSGRHCVLSVPCTG